MFLIHDALRNDGIDYIFTPAHKITMEKVSKVKTDKRDARRLALYLENNNYTIFHIPDREIREYRQVCRTLSQIQIEIAITTQAIRNILKNESKK